MSPKVKNDALDLLKKVPLQWRAPQLLEGATLLEHAVLFVLTRDLTEPQAVATLKALRSRYPDWNEPRVAQIQELAGCIRSKSQETRLQASRNLKELLQEIFQENHGFELEPLCEDYAAFAKFVSALEFLGLGAGNILLWLACDKQWPVSQGLVRVLDRLGLMHRTTSLKKARVAMEAMVRAEDVLEFAVGFGTVVDRWCEARRPSCQDCPLREDCPHGKKVYKDWLAQQSRIEAQRKRELQRIETQRKKEEARQKREAERRRRQQEVEAKKRSREMAKLRREEEKRRREEERERLRQERERQKVERAKAAKLAKEKEAKAALEARKKAAKKKAAKKVAKKVTKKVTKKAGQKVSKKKPSKPATKKKAAAKAAPKRSAPKRSAGKQSAKKKAPVKKVAKKAAKKKAVKKKAVKKKAVKKKTAAKKTTKKTSRRR